MLALADMAAFSAVPSGRSSMYFAAEIKTCSAPDRFCDTVIALEGHRPIHPSLVRPGLYLQQQPAHSSINLVAKAATVPAIAAAG
jgi:hypothetical protein